MHKLKTYIVGFTTFLIPIFFLTITHEFYDINKFMLISISVIILLSISTMQLIQKRKFKHYSVLIIKYNLSSILQMVLLCSLRWPFTSGT
jgi:hypothetical protein